MFLSIIFHLITIKPGHIFTVTRSRVKYRRMFWISEIIQHWFSYFQIARKYWTSFMANPLNIIFDNFGI